MLLQGGNLRAALTGFDTAEGKYLAEHATVHRYR
jgi:hypothetical protein